MPRKKDVGAVEVLEFFRAAPLDMATLLLELVKGEVRRRQPKAAAGTAAGTTTGTAPATGSGQIRAKKTGSRRTTTTVTAAGPTAQPATGTSAVAPLPGFAPMGGEVGGGTS